jgi:hypothetical protein
MDGAGKKSACSAMEGLNAGMWTIGVTQSQSGNALGLSHNQVQALALNDLDRCLTTIESLFRKPALTT